MEAFWQLLGSYFWSFDNFWEGFWMWPPSSQKLIKSCQKLRSNIRPGPLKLSTGCVQLSKSWSKAAETSKVTFDKVSKSFQKSTRGEQALGGSKAEGLGRRGTTLPIRGQLWQIAVPKIPQKLPKVKILFQMIPESPRELKS